MTLDQIRKGDVNENLSFSNIEKKSLAEAYRDKSPFDLWRIDYQKVDSKVYNHKFDFFVVIQKAITSYYWSIYNEYWIWFKSPYADFDKKGNFITEWEWSHTFPDSKDPSEYNNFIKLIQLMKIHPEAALVIKKSIVFWKAIKKHLKSIHIHNGTRHEKVIDQESTRSKKSEFKEIIFEIESDDPKEYIRYNSIMRDFYWLLWPFRKEIFEEIETESLDEKEIKPSKKKVQLALTSQWKKMLIYVFQILFNEYNSDDSRSPWIEKVFTTNQEKRIKTLLVKWVNLSNNDILKVLDVLLMKNYSTNGFLKKITKTYSKFKTTRAGSKRKIFSRINNTSLWRSILRFIDKSFMKEKNKRTSDKKDYWTFMDSFVTLLVVLHKYKIDEVEKIFANQNDFCSKLQNDIKSEFPWLKCEISSKVKDIYSCVQKLLTSPWRMTLSDIIWFQIEYSTSECEEEFTSSQIELLFYEKIFQFYKEKWFSINKDIFIVGEESDSVIRWLSNTINSDKIKRKENTTKLTQSNPSYKPYSKVQWVIENGEIEIPFENRIREAGAIENNMAAYSYYKIKNTLNMYSRERIHFTLQEYSEKVEEFIRNHYTYCIEKRNHHQERYERTWDSFDLSRVEKYSKEAIIDTKSRSYNLIEDSNNLLGPEWIKKEFLKDVVCTFMNEELNQWDYMEFIYESDISSSIYSDLYKSKNTISSISMEDCYSWSDITENIKFTWRNIKYNIETSLFPTRTRIWQRNRETNETTFLTNSERIDLIKVNDFWNDNTTNVSDTNKKRHYLWIKQRSHTKIYQLEAA